MEAADGTEADRWRLLNVLPRASRTTGREVEKALVQEVEAPRLDLHLVEANIDSIPGQPNGYERCER